MVERKVKLMSVQASPSVKKIMQRLARSRSAATRRRRRCSRCRAPISHSAMMPTRMPTCAATIAQVGQSFCTGRRRTGLGVGLSLAALCGAAVRDGNAGNALACPESAIQAASSSAGASTVSRFEAALLDGDELRRQRAWCARAGAAA